MHRCLHTCIRGMSETLGKKAFLEKLSDYNLIVVSVTNTNRSPKRNFGLDTEEIEFINELSKSNRVVLNHFGNPYALSQFESFDDIDALIVFIQ